MYRYSLIVFALSLLGGCAGGGIRSGPPVPVEDQSGTVYSEQAKRGPDAAGMDEPGGSSDRPGERDETMQGDMQPIVVALLDAAEQELQSGREEHAVAVIERALNLEPKNAPLWSRLAAIRLQQGIWRQAYVMANKSNSLAQGDRVLQIRNWQIIEKARMALGDMAGSAEAGEIIKKLKLQR